jgi:hypothetical protein
MKVATALVFVSLTLICAPATYADSFGNGANSFDIQFVTIGNPGNAPDTTGNPNPAGSVGYEYRIGKFEISRDMIIKANADGGLGITLADMTPYGGNGANRPATGVTWFEVVTFVNWLNTSKGYAPAYKFDGSGNFQLWEASDEGYDSNNLFRNKLARYILPSLNEWYKAAYYNPSANVYYDYPTGSDSEPDGIDFPGDTMFDGVFGAEHPNDITNVGITSPYGTAGQGGNVWELLETESDFMNDSVSSRRLVRGGIWDVNPDLSLSTNFGGTPHPTTEVPGFGFRVASQRPLLLGDYNEDDYVDAADFVVWRKHVGRVVPICSFGDANCNGFVEVDEDQPWRENFGRSSPAGTGQSGYVGTAVTIPEPSMLLLGAVAGLGLLFSKRTRSV